MLAQPAERPGSFLSLIPKLTILHVRLGAKSSLYDFFKYLYATEYFLNERQGLVSLEPEPHVMLERAVMRDATRRQR